VSPGVYVLLCTIICCSAALWWKQMDNVARGIELLPRLKTLEDKAEYITAQVGETQRAVVKVDNKLVKLAQAAGHAAAIK
jgi:uncharacterized protein YacL